MSGAVLAWMTDAGAGDCRIDPDAPITPVGDDVLLVLRAHATGLADATCSGPCRLAWLLAAALIALLFGVVAPAQALPQPSAHLHHYVYDAAVHDSVLTDTATERGPPVAWDTDQDRTAVGRASNGVLARPAMATVSDNYDHDGSPQFVQAAQGGNTDARPVGALTGQLSSVHPGQVAAKSGDDLIRLSTKESWGNLKTLDDHFARHGADFGAKSADDYARMGSEFFQRGGAQQLPTKIAPDGTIRMFDPATNTFGSFAPNGMTKTLFKPTSSGYWSKQPGVLQ